MMIFELSWRNCEVLDKGLSLTTYLQKKNMWAVKIPQLTAPGRQMQRLRIVGLSDRCTIRLQVAFRILVVFRALGR
jgi:hypothetical protein